jgi:hypothetical protein
MQSKSTGFTRAWKLLRLSAEEHPSPHAAAGNAESDTQFRALRFRFQFALCREQMALVDLLLDPGKTEASLDFHRRRLERIRYARHLKMAMLVINSHA